MRRIPSESVASRRLSGDQRAPLMFSVPGICCAVSEPIGLSHATRFPSAGCVAYRIHLPSGDGIGVPIRPGRAISKRSEGQSRAFGEERERQESLHLQQQWQVPQPATFVENLGTPVPPRRSQSAPQEDPRGTDACPRCAEGAARFNADDSNNRIDAGVLAGSNSRSGGLATIFARTAAPFTCSSP
jgi:hypothetical protein